MQEGREGRREGRQDGGEGSIIVRREGRGEIRWCRKEGGKTGR